MPMQYPSGENGCSFLSTVPKECNLRAEHVYMY